MIGLGTSGLIAMYAAAVLGAGLVGAATLYYPGIASKLTLRTMSR